MCILICSKFHDYYDKITAWGIDKTVVYQREQSEPEQIKGPEIYGTYWRHPSHSVEACRIIGFCGKLYPLLEINLLKKYQIIYDKKKALQYCSDSGRKTYRFMSRFGNVYDAFNVDNFKSLLPIFVERKAPVFIYGDYLGMLDKYPKHSKQLILNPQLQEWGFASVKDPVTAFQEIYMYISGVLGVDVKPTVEISDKYKAIAHGHDGRFSFKQPPGKAKRTRRLKEKKTC